MKLKQGISDDRAASMADSANPLVNRTNAEIDAWVDANVATLAQARVVFKQLIKLQRNVLRRIAKMQ